VSRTTSALERALRAAASCACAQRFWLAAFSLALLAAMIPADSGAGSGPLTYAYDPLGRLVAVVDGSGNAAQYKYDAVGNLTSISTTTSSTTSVFTFAPVNGPVGMTVTIYGDGFSTTPSQNTVKFYNGVVAAVSASTIATLTVTVPSSAAYGPITVTGPHGTATSSQYFTVE
jgi:YD repeat-containing protein